MSSNFETSVDAFLRRLGQFRTGDLRRIWKAFMAYSLCIAAEAFRRRGYRVYPGNHAQGFRFKCFPRGNPDDYSYFAATKGSETLEIRLSVDSQNLHWNSLRLNLDIVVIPENSINNNYVVDSESDLVAFAECKNLRGFPELVASLEGMIYELQRSRLYRNSSSNYRIPCCLLLSQPGRSILFMDGRYQSRNMSVRIFDSLQPRSQNVQNFIQSWF